MRSLPIRYVRDVPAAQRFYEALGLRVDFAGRAPREGTSRWVEMIGSDGGLLALHLADESEPSDRDRPVDPSSGAVVAIGLAFEADEPLEAVVTRLRAAGYEPATAIVDESYGRSFTVLDPEGLTIQINEHDRDLHA